jgi:hypothetical protein
MKHTSGEILSVLDRCCDEFTFPMLDNGYFYLAATRLSLHRSEEDWAMVIECFGYSPREGIPSVHVTTFASRFHDRDPPENYVTREAYENYLRLHPHDEFRSFDPIAEGDWLEPDDCELVPAHAAELSLRGLPVALPDRSEYALLGIELEDPGHVRVFELCRYLAAVRREDVLATPAEQRVSVLPEMTKLLQLDEWHHPNVVDETQRPSDSETFRQLAEVLVTGDLGLYGPTEAPNTHWVNWPDGGSL